MPLLPVSLDQALLNSIVKQVLHFPAGCSVSSDKGPRTMTLKRFRLKAPLVRLNAFGECQLSAFTPFLTMEKY